MDNPTFSGGSANNIALRDLLVEVRSCRHCEQHLPHDPRPIVRLANSAKLLIIGQAPGSKVHSSGIPWDDPSGDRLRRWLGLSVENFYDETKVAIVPMGFCYPGRGRSGDLPPRPECAPMWHSKLLTGMQNIELVLLVGRYAQDYYLERDKITIAQRIRQADWAGAKYLPLVHPSPRNGLWLRNNAWFEADFVPVLQERVTRVSEWGASL